MTKKPMKLDQSLNTRIFNSQYLRGDGMKFTSSIIVFAATLILTSTSAFADAAHKKKTEAVQVVTAQECKNPTARNIKACKALEKAAHSHSSDGKKDSHSH